MSAETFRRNIIDSGKVIERTGDHSEFQSGMHGQKIDFEGIEPGSDLSRQWTAETADHLSALPHLPEVILSVANGTNNLVYEVAKEFNGNLLPLVSQRSRSDSNKLILPNLAQKIIKAIRPRLLYVLEDVGTTGGSALQVVHLAQQAGAKEVKVLNGWQRRQYLEQLMMAGVEWESIITDYTDYPTYTKEECEDRGYCADDWHLNKYKRR